MERVLALVAAAALAGVAAIGLRRTAQGRRLTHQGRLLLARMRDDEPPPSPARKRRRRRA